MFHGTESNRLRMAHGQQPTLVADQVRQLPGLSMRLPSTLPDHLYSRAYEVRDSSTGKDANAATDPDSEQLPRQ